MDHSVAIQLLSIKEARAKYIAFLVYNPPRNPHYGYPRSENILDYHCTCTDLYIVSNADIAQYLGSLPNVYIVADSRGILRIGTYISYTAIAMNRTVSANSGPWINYD